LLKIEQAELEKKIQEEAQKAAESLSKMLGSLKMDIQQFQEQHKAHVEQKASASAEEAQIRATIDQLNVKLKQLQAGERDDQSLKALIEEQSQLEAQKAELATAVGSLTQELGQQKQATSELEAKLEQLKADLASAEQTSADGLAALQSQVRSVAYGLLYF